MGLQEAIDEFKLWSGQHLEAEQSRNTIAAPLYHYTDGRGLKGILESETIWFTDYRHLNDPTELIHGICTGHNVIRKVASGADARVRLFLDRLGYLLSADRLSSTLEFFIASFSRERNDLGQWRAYADNGRGYAIGFAPQLFGIVEESVREPHENVFVGPVLYEPHDVSTRHHQSIEKAASIFLKAANSNPELMQDETTGKQFMRDMVNTVMASPLIWNCLTSKHPAYAHENEVRMIILGTRDSLLPYISTRTRVSEIVPYIAHKMPLRQADSIVEIVVGPAAPVGAKTSIQTIMHSLGGNLDVPIRPSGIPYRAL